jgi:hypothetical protein
LVTAPPLLPLLLELLPLLLPELAPLPEPPPLLPLDPPSAPGPLLVLLLLQLALHNPMTTHAPANCHIVLMTTKLSF